MNYEVKNWRANTGGGQVQGFFTLVYGDLDINDCKLVDGQNGKFIALPQRKYVKDGADKWTAVVFAPNKDRRQALNDWAVCSPQAWG